MDWENFKVDRFAKLMAMAFSTQENEATAALRMAGRMLREADGTFDDIADLLKRPMDRIGLPPGQEMPKVAARDGDPQRQTPGTRDWISSVTRERLARAEARVQALTQENETYRKQLDDAIKYIVELETHLANARRGL